jgi:hypothetical protein
LQRAEAEKEKSRARRRARWAQAGSSPEVRQLRASVDFGLGAGVALLLWKLPLLHPWGGVPGLVIFYAIVIWGGGTVGAGFFLMAYLVADYLYQWVKPKIASLPARRRLVLALAAGVAAVAIIAVAGAALGSAGGYLLPAVFVAGCGLWLWLLCSRAVRNRAAILPRLLPDVIGAATAAGALLPLAEHNLVTAEPAAGFLFPIAVWGAVRIWQAMKGSDRVAARAGADITFSLLLGAELVLFLVWLANLLGMPRPEVAVLRAVLSQAGAVVDLPWWVWTVLYGLLAAASLAFVLRPARTAAVRRWFGRLRLVPAANAARRVLGGVHIGLLAIVFVGLTAPAALLPTFQRQLASAYTVALQRQFEAHGEVTAYTRIRREFGAGTAPPALVEVVTGIHDQSPASQGGSATGAEDEISRRLGALQAATLNLANARALLDADAIAARQAGLDAPVRGESDLAGRLGEVAAQDQNADEAESSATQAGDLAASAIASTISIANVGGSEAFQIIREYLSGLVEESGIKDTFAEWAKRLAGAQAPPDADAMVVPDPGKLEHAAYEELASEFAAAGDASEFAGDQAVSNALDESPVDAAVSLASQAVQEAGGSCAACTPSGPDDEPLAPPDDGD